jgi:hypothetical protein
MASKTTRVLLYRPDGGTVREYNDVEVLSYNKDMIEFSKRVEEGDEVVITEYTSNLSYIITEVTTGPKSLI